MSENNSEKIEISYRSLGLDEARKQSPLLFLVENDEDNKKKNYIYCPPKNNSQNLIPLPFINFLVS